MTWLRLPRLPVRARITAAFAVVMTVLLSGISVAVYTSTANSLLDELDSGLRFRAQAIATPSSAGARETVDPALAEPGEAFDQLVTVSGRVLRSSPGLLATSILTRPELAAVRRPTLYDRSRTSLGSNVAWILCVLFATSARSRRPLGCLCA